MSFPALASTRLAIGTLPCALAFALLGACSGAPETDRAATDEQPAQLFSQEERIAARALSIGNRGIMEEAESPYQQAVECSGAIAALAERFRQAGGLTSEQLAIVDQAKAVYDRRMQLLAGQARQADQDTGPDQPSSAEDSPEPGARALLAVGCIQRLAQAG
jgi:hypothetical protein